VAFINYFVILLIVDLHLEYYHIQVEANMNLFT